MEKVLNKYDGKELTFIKINKNIVLNHELSMQEKVILGILDVFNNTFMTNEYLAKITGLSLSRIEKIIPSLIKRGFLRAKYERNNVRIEKRFLTVNVPDTKETFLNERFNGLSIRGEYIKSMKLSHAFVFSVIILLDNNDEGCCLNEKEWKQITNLNKSARNEILKKLENDAHIVSKKATGMSSVFFVKDRSILNFKCTKNDNKPTEIVRETDRKTAMNRTENGNEPYGKVQRDSYNYINIYSNNKEKNTKTNNTEPQAHKHTSKKQNKKYPHSYLYPDNSYPEDIVPDYF